MCALQEILPHKWVYKQGVLRNPLEDGHEKHNRIVVLK